MDLHIYRNSQDRWHDVKAAARENGAVLAFNALTLDELVQKLTPGIRAASAGQRLILTQAAVREAEAAGVPGVSRYSQEALAELKGARVRASELAAAGAGLMARILAGYDDVCRQAGLADPQERIWLAAAAVNSAAASGWLERYERVVLHALYDINEAQFTLLQSLIEAMPGGGTVMLFNTTANVKPTRFAEWTWQRFIQNEALADKTFPEFCRPLNTSRAVLERLFVFETQGQNGDENAGAPLPSDDSLRILQAPGRYREIEAIGSEIAELLSSGASPADIAVVVRHIETYGEMIEDVFSRYRLPHVFETGVPLLRVPLIKYWLSLLDLVASERSRDALSRIMASAYYLPRLSPQVDCLNELISFGYIDRNHIRASALAAAKGSPLAPDLARLEERLDSLEAATDTVAGFLRRLQLGGEPLERDRHAWQILMEELHSVDSIAGRLSFAEFRRVASEVAGLRTTDRLSPSGVPPGVLRVRILPPSSLGYRTWRWIFAPGLADGEFPARTFSNPLLPAAALDELNRQMRPRRVMTARDRSRLEPLYLFTVLDSASERVTLSWPASTLEGDAIYPSVYIGEIVRHYHESPVVQLDRGLQAREPGECLRKIADVWRSGAIDEQSARELLGDDVVRRALWEAKGVMRGDVGSGSIPVDTVWHPSELNSLAACPFTFLARHRLKLKTLTAPDFEVPASEVGILAHAVLREFHAQAVAELPPESLQEAIHEAGSRMCATISRVLANVDISGQGPYSVFDPGLWRIRRRQLVSTLMRYAEFAVRDAIDGFETVPEYLDKALPPARLGQILLGGKPDHIAVRRGNGGIAAIRIDDFKYSAVSGSTMKQLKQSVQVPVYAWLALQAIGGNPNAVIEGRYLLLRSPSHPVIAHPIERETFDVIQARVEQLLEKVRHGTLHPDPADRQDCHDCDYRRLCRMYGS